MVKTLRVYLLYQFGHPMGVILLATLVVLCVVQDKMQIHTVTLIHDYKMCIQFFIYYFLYQ